MQSVRSNFIFFQKKLKKTDCTVLAAISQTLNAVHLVIEWVRYERKRSILLILVELYSVQEKYSK
jgi:hypothetical protein